MPKIIQNGVEYSTVPSTLSTLSDTDISSSTLANGQVLGYNGTSGKWENGSAIKAVTNTELNTITPTASGVTNYGQGSYYYQKGKLTFVHINVQGLTANSQATIYTMPDGAKPIKDVFAAGLCGNSYTGIANVTITASGYVKVASVDTYASAYVVYVAV